MEAPIRGTFADLEKYVEEEKQRRIRADKIFWRDSEIWHQKMDALNKAIGMLCRRFDKLDPDDIRKRLFDAIDYDTSEDANKHLQIFKLETLTLLIHNGHPVTKLIETLEVENESSQLPHRSEKQ